MMKVVRLELLAGPHLVDSGADDARAEPFGQIQHARVKSAAPERVVGLAADRVDDVQPVILSRPPCKTTGLIQTGDCRFGRIRDSRALLITADASSREPAALPRKRGALLPGERNSASATPKCAVHGKPYWLSDPRSAGPKEPGRGA